MASDNIATMGQTMVALEPQTCEASDNAISEQKDADIKYVPLFTASRERMKGMICREQNCQNMLAGQISNM